MNLWLAAITIISIWGSGNAFPRRNYYINESTLELVHVLFRHGDRNPDEVNLYPSNPYYAESNYFYGYGQLTNEGKMREYKLGTALRQRYNNFLGKDFNMSILDVRSTDYNRTKMSAQLMTAGLWPPTGLNIWRPVLSWQPIPYNYEKSSNDKELSAILACNTFGTLVDELLETSLNIYMNSRYSEMFNTLANWTGYEITYLRAFRLYFGFAIQEELNLPLEDWTSAVYPEPLHSFVLDYYYIQTNTTALRKIISGYLIKKVITDTKNKISGTLIPEGRKMFLYSGHERNIATLLLSLQAYSVVQLPPLASYVLIELHKIDGVYGVMIFYQDYTNDDPHGPLSIPGCDEFCPFDQFVSLMEEILPSSDEECYGSSMKSRY